MHRIIIIDYGSQVTQLIARRVREAGIYSEIVPCGAEIEKIAAMHPDGVILSGGPASVLDQDSPGLDPALLRLGVPVLGICYGMQLLAHSLGGQLAPVSDREYGPALLTMSAPSPLWHGLERTMPTQVWMSHGDTVAAPPPGFKVIGCTETLDIAAMADDERRIYALQFHPEVHHSADGQAMLANFLFEICRLKPDWSMAAFVDNAISTIRDKVGSGHAICALSGGIDSTVVAVLCHKAIGDRLHCVYVDNGLMRLNESAQVIETMRRHFNLNLIDVNAGGLFLDRLKGIEDPEKKRKIIGHTFIEIFEAEAKKLPEVQFLAQGTLYPDVIESISSKGPSAVIKSHHNVGGLPEHMKLELLEPLRELFKDEVRKVALELDVPENIVWRQPFPGPGLAIRVLGAVSEDRLNILRKADHIVLEEIRAAGLYKDIWQSFAVLLPLRTVGVMGDSRTYDNVIALRCVDSVDAMTADWTRLPPDALARISSRIINEVQGVNRVVYDISSKPPATIEWE